MKIGAQLYTVREFTQNEKDFAETIKKVAEIGYPGAQLSAVGDIPAQTIADICAENNIIVMTTHMAAERILNDTDNLIAEHKLFGSKQIGIGSMPAKYRSDLDGTKQFIKDFSPAAKKIKAAGMKFAYHNHDFEFQKFDGKLVLEHLIDGFASDELEFILDTYWIQNGGGDPAWWIRRLSGRIPNIHLKDMTVVNGNEKRFCPIGEGNLNWESIFAACREAGVEWVVVEQDNGYGRDPFDCLRSSFEFIAKTI